MAHARTIGHAQSGPDAAHHRLELGDGHRVPKGYALLRCRGIYCTAGPGTVGQRDEGLAGDLRHGDTPQRGQTMLTRHHGVEDLAPEWHHGDRIWQFVHKGNSQIGCRSRQLRARHATGATRDRKWREIPGHLYQNRKQNCYPILIDMRQGIPNFRPVVLQRGSEGFRTMHLGGVAARSRTPPDGNRSGR